jgi:hypothetical protein
VEEHPDRGTDLADRGVRSDVEVKPKNQAIVPPRWDDGFLIPVYSIVIHPA